MGALTLDEKGRLVKIERGVQHEAATFLRHMVLGIIPSRPLFEDLADTSYTLKASDHGKIRCTTYASAGEIIVPTGLPPDFWVVVLQDGTGQVTFNVDDVTCYEPDSQFKTEKQYVMVTLMARGANNYRLLGRTAP